MDFAVTVQSANNVLHLIEANADILILQNKDISPRFVASFDFDEMEGMIQLAHQNGVKVYVQMTLMIHEDMTETVERWIKWASRSNVDGILFADTGLISLAKTVGLTDRLIYQPGTLTTNTYDITFWENQGLKGLVLAREITKNDVLKFVSKSSFIIGMTGHGYLNMFHSKRPLITNFFKYQGEENRVYDNLKLIEEKRQESYPIIENEHGTHIFRTKPMHSFSALMDLNQVLDVFIIDGILSDESATIQALIDYKTALKKPDQCQALIEKYDKSHDSGFLYKETVYKAF